MHKLSIAIVALASFALAGNAYAGILDGGNTTNNNNNINSSSSHAASNSHSNSSSNSFSQGGKGGTALSTSAGGKGGKGGKASANNSGVNNSSNYREKLQAPGLSVSGSYCSNAFGISVPGGGFGFSTMERTCKTEIGAKVAKTYLGGDAAAQYVCQQREYSNLTVCKTKK